MSAPSGVLVIKNIPHGFYEQQLVGFFSQFGKVEAARVRRGRDSGRSCGIAFVKFKFPEVAPIAAESMDNYHMFGATLRCHAKSVAWEKARPKLFRPKDAARVVLRKGEGGFVEERDRRLQSQIDKAKAPPFASYKQYLKKCHNMVTNDTKLRERLKAEGIDYSYPPLAMPSEMQAEWDRHKEEILAEVEAVERERKRTKEPEAEELKDASPDEE